MHTARMTCGVRAGGRARRVRGSGAGKRAGRAGPGAGRGPGRGGKSAKGAVDGGALRKYNSTAFPCGLTMPEGLIPAPSDGGVAGGLR
jgi:hypothetical protein